MFKRALLAGLVACIASNVALAQTSPSGINSTSPGSEPLTGGSYAPSNPLPPIVTTPLGGSMSSSTYGSSGTYSLSGNSGIGASTGNSTGSAGSEAGSSLGNVAGSSAGSVTGSSTAPLYTPGSSQDYVDQAELARCNGMVGTARETCVGNLRDRMDMNSGVGARSTAGGHLGTGNGAGIARGSQLPPPLIGPASPAPNPPMGPGSGGLPQRPVTSPASPVR